MRCEVCQNREATVHVTSVVSGEPGSEQRNLCEECARRDEAFGGVLPPGRLEDQSCVYCGAPATHGEPAEMPVPGKVTPWRYFCQPCTKEKNRFMLEQVPGLATGSMSPATIQALGDILVRTDEHLKRWVKERKLDS